MASQLQQNLIEIKEKLEEAGAYIDGISEHTEIDLRPYTPLQYIQLSNDAYIPFNISPSNTIKFQVRVKCSAATGGKIVGGSYQNGETSAFRLFNYNNTIYLDYGSGSDRNRIYGSTWSNNVIYELEVGNRYVRNLSTGSNIISSSSVGAFNYSTGTIGLVGDAITTTFYYFKMWKNNNLVVNAIPVKMKSNNAVGMWDFITEQFYTTSGGTIMAGPEMDDTNSYTELEYIESTGPQYIDTGIIPNTNTQIDVDFMSTNLGNYATIIFGAETGYNDNAFHIYQTNGIFDVGFSKQGLDYGNMLTNTRYSTSLKNNSLKINNNVYTGLTGTINISYTLTLFALHRDSILLDTSCSKRIYFCKIYNSRNTN